MRFSKKNFREKKTDKFSASPVIAEFLHILILFLKNIMIFL
jgi:hypothetical protein